MSPRSFRTTLRVSWVDTDAAGVVHFSNYFRFFERAEEDFYTHLGFSFTDIKNRSFWLPRVETFCQYKKPAKFNDLLDVELTIGGLKDKSVKYDFKVYNKGSSELVANGYMVVVAADKQTGRATQIPPEIVAKLKPHS